MGSTGTNPATAKEKVATQQGRLYIVTKDYQESKSMRRSISQISCLIPLSKLVSAGRLIVQGEFAKLGIFRYTNPSPLPPTRLSHANNIAILKISRDFLSDSASVA